MVRTKSVSPSARLAREMAPHKRTAVQAFALKYLRSQEQRAGRPSNPVHELRMVDWANKAVMRAPKGTVKVHRALSPARVIVSMHSRGDAFVQKNYKATPTEAEELRQRAEVQAVLAAKGAPIAKPLSRPLETKRNGLSMREEYVGPSFKELIESAALEGRAGLRKRLLKMLREAQKKMTQVAGENGFTASDFNPGNSLFDVKNNRVVFTDLHFTKPRGNGHG